MSTRFKARLTLFEGILIGIYGNWLISLVNKITFTKILVFLGVKLWTYQMLCIVTSFIALILIFAYRLFLPKKSLRAWHFAVFASAHLVGALFALSIEMVNVSLSSLLQNILFFVIGALLFFLIYGCELRLGRTRYKQRKSEKA